MDVSISKHCFDVFGLVCCPFAVGATQCINISKEIRNICPIHNQTVKGHLPHTDVVKVIYHFQPLFYTLFTAFKDLMLGFVSIMVIC